MRSKVLSFEHESLRLDESGYETIAIELSRNQSKMTIHKPFAEVTNKAILGQLKQAIPIDVYFKYTLKSFDSIKLQQDSVSSR